MKFFRIRNPAVHFCDGDTILQIISFRLVETNTKIVETLLKKMENIDKKIIFLQLAHIFRKIFWYQFTLANYCLRHVVRSVKEEKQTVMKKDGLM